MIELRLLGPTDLRAADGTEIRSVLVQPKRLALLAYLAAELPLGYHRRETLLALLWPEADDASARNSLRKTIYHLRQACGEDAVAGRGNDEIAVSADHIWCDVSAFAEAVRDGQLARALELYRGDLLTGFALADCAEFEEWLSRLRVRLREQASRAAISFAQQEETAGRLRSAITTLDRARELHPDNEDTLRRLLVLQHHAGDRAAMEAAFGKFERYLKTEYDAEPAPETVALIERLRTTTDVPERLKSPSLESPSIEVGTEVATPGETPPPRRQRRRTTVIAAAFSLIFVATAAIALRGRATPLQRNRVLVHRFINETGDSTLDALSGLAADWVTQGLSATGVVTVAEPVAIPKNAQADRSALPAARAVGAGTAVSGAFYLEGNTIRIQANILETKSGRVLDAIAPVKVHRDSLVGGVEQVRQRVMASLASLVDPRLSTWGSTSMRPPTFAAYQAYAEANRFQTENDFAPALHHYLRAAALDSSFTPALIWAAHMQANLYQWAAADSIAALLTGSRRPDAPYDLYNLDRLVARLRGDARGVYTAAHRMADASLGSQEAQRHIANAALRLNRPRETVRILDGLDPDSGWLRGWFGYWQMKTSALHMLDDHELELREARRGRERNPLLLSTLWHETRALAALGRTAELRQKLDEGRALAPHGRWTLGLVLLLAAEELEAHDHPSAEFYDLTLKWFESQPPSALASEPAMHSRYVRTLYRAGRLDRAAAEIAADLRSRPNDVDLHGMKGVVAARLGRRAEAQAEEQWLTDTNQPFAFGEQLRWRARIAAVSGRADDAMRLLEQGSAQGAGVDEGTHSMPELFALRGRRDFQEFMRPKG